jgi:hypothetical protein
MKNHYVVSNLILGSPIDNIVEGTIERHFLDFQQDFPNQLHVNLHSACLFFRLTPSRLLGGRFVLLVVPMLPSQAEYRFTSVPSNGFASTS